MVSVARFELATPYTPCKCATRLRHTESNWWTVGESNSRCCHAMAELSRLTNSPFYSTNTAGFVPVVCYTIWAQPVFDSVYSKSATDFKVWTVYCYKCAKAFGMFHSVTQGCKFLLFNFIHILIILLFELLVNWCPG